MAAQLAPLVGIQPACRSLLVPRASFYRTQQPAPADRSDRIHPTGLNHSHPRALSTLERAGVLATLNSQRFCDLAPPQVFATLLEEGTYLCSLRSMYRYLDQDDLVRERRNQRRHPRHPRPELVATAPNQIWTWDITKLRGPLKWSWYYLYVVLDLYSRYVVGWMVATRECATLAQRLLAESYRKHAIAPDQLTVHSDRGSPMVAKPLALLLADLGVVRSFSRPRVSNDNPFSESQFKTLKYHRDFPDRFGSLEDARLFGQHFFPWYNTAHRHSGIAYLTPQTVHFGSAPAVLHRRQTTLQAAFARHPERFVRGAPKAPQLPAAVWINPPLAFELHPTEPEHAPVGPLTPATLSPKPRSNPICHMRARGTGL